MVEMLPEANYQSGDSVRCTHISIPQVSRTHAVLLCRPWWMWGAEMGVNARGVAIGNEAVFSRAPPNREPALLGMDLLRLALERAATAVEAVEIIVRLLEEHGQGGNCSNPGPSCYDNSFIVTDKSHAFVLETAGKRWVAEEVVSTRAISNLYTISDRASACSENLDAWLGEMGWSEGPVRDYASAIGDPDKRANGGLRWARSSALLREREGALSTFSMMQILRDHGSEGGSDPSWRPKPPRTQLCLHADGEDPRGQTVNSLLCELGNDRLVAWTTASAATCLSIFKPVAFGAPVPALGPALTGTFDERAFWWQHDRLQRALLADPAIDLAELRAERDALEARFLERMDAALAEPDAARLSQVIADCWRDAMAMEARWALML